MLKLASVSKNRTIRAGTAGSAGLLAFIPPASGDHLDDLVDTFREATFFQSESGDLTLHTDPYLTSDTPITRRPAPGIYKAGSDVLASRFPIAARSNGSAPSDWVASTTRAAPTLRSSAAIVARSSNPPSVQ